MEAVTLVVVTSEEREEVGLKKGKKKKRTKMRTKETKIRLRSI